VVDHASEVYVRGQATSDLRLARTRDARAPAPGQFEAVGLHAVTEQRAAVVISEISSTAAPSTGESSVRLVPVETDGHGSRTNQASASSVGTGSARAETRSAWIERPACRPSTAEGSSSPYW